MNILKLTSHAKLNLYLKILGKRPDNYHSIITLFERINLSDQIELRSLPGNKIKIKSSGLAIPCNYRNLAYQAALLLQRKFAVNKGIEIRIKKNIPVSAGLGGGSSNAASVLIGLNKFWKLNLTNKQLSSFACRIGADVAFFLENCSFASASARGDKITALNLKIKLWQVIIVPRIRIRSSVIYSRWDKQNKDRGLTRLERCSYLTKRKSLTGLTKPQSVIRILTALLSKKDITSLSKLIYNSLEKVSIAIYPVIIRMKRALSELGLKAILMSGSGSAVFGLVSSRKEAYEVLRRLKKSGNWDVFVARTI